MKTANESHAAFGRLRVWYPWVTSTMDIAAALAIAGAPHGTVVEAALQTAGRGRQGNRWQTGNQGSLLSTWILRLPSGDDHPLILSPLIALALLRVIRQLAPDAPSAFKWPNDVLVDGLKVGGILPVARRGIDETVVIVGIGVNVARSGVPDDVSASALDEWCVGVTVADVRDTLAYQLATVLDEAACSLSLVPGHLVELRAALAWTSLEVDVVTNDSTITGRLETITADGALIMRPSRSQHAIALHIGEIVRGPRKVVPVDA